MPACHDRPGTEKGRDGTQPPRRFRVQTGPRMDAQETIPSSCRYLGSKNLWRWIHQQEKWPFLGADRLGYYQVSPAAVQ